jgi:serine/threonine protein kinase
VGELSLAEICRRRHNVRHHAALPVTAERELAALRTLAHPNIVRLQAWYPDGGAVAIVMEHMDTDLGFVLRRVGAPLPPDIAKGIALMLVRGVAYCHSHGILHRVSKRVPFSHPGLAGAPPAGGLLKNHTHALPLVCCSSFLLLPRRTSSPQTC